MGMTRPIIGIDPWDAMKGTEKWYFPSRLRKAPDPVHDRHLVVHTFPHGLLQIREDLAERDGKVVLLVRPAVVARGREFDFCYLSLLLHAGERYAHLGLPQVNAALDCPLGGLLCIGKEDQHLRHVLLRTDFNKEADKLLLLVREILYGNFLHDITRFP